MSLDEFMGLTPDAPREMVMAAQNNETVVDKVTSYVKDMLGIPQDRPADGEAKPERAEIAPAAAFDENAPLVIPNPAPPVELGSYSTKTAAELNAESARREDGAE